MKFTIATAVLTASFVNASPAPKVQGTASMIPDGQVQAPTSIMQMYEYMAAKAESTPVQAQSTPASNPDLTQISDHQPQAPTVAPGSTPASASYVSQISDHQPQAPTVAPASTPAPTVAPASTPASAPAYSVPEYSAPSASQVTVETTVYVTASDCTVCPEAASTPAYSAPQAPGPSSEAPISQISDRQPQAPTSLATSAPAAAPTTSPETPVSQISDHQPQAPASEATSAPAKASATFTSPSTPVTSSSVCPLTLAGKTYEYPHLMMPLTADSAAQTNYTGKCSDDDSTLFRFDIPTSYSGSICEVIFALPRHDSMETSDYQMSNTSMSMGSMGVIPMSSVPYEGMSLDDAVAERTGDEAMWSPVVDGIFTVYKGPCAAGQSIGFMMQCVGMSLTYFQDYNPCPVGMYVLRE